MVVAARALSSEAVELIAAEKIHNISIDVILASHAHHVPQVGLPHIEPVTNAIMLKTKPDGAKLFAIKKKFLFLRIYPPKDKNVINEKIPREIQAAGT